MPNIKIGETYTYNSHGGCEEMAPYDGKKAKVLRAVGEDEIDIEETGAMYGVEFEDGKVTEVFADELAALVDYSTIIQALYTAAGTPNGKTTGYTFLTDGDLILMKPSASDTYEAAYARVEAIADFIETITGITDLTTGRIEDDDSMWNGCFYIDTNG